MKSSAKVKFFDLTAKQNQGKVLFGGDFLGKGKNFATELQHNIRYFAAENLRLNAEF